MITDLSQLDLSKKYSYADYLRWKFKERVELFKGFIFKMSPAPSNFHQGVSFDLTGIFYNYFKTKECIVRVAPFDVRIIDKKKSKKDKDIYTVVQPDLCVICDKEKLDERGCIGTPDLIVEILSPGNTKKEMKIKFELYEEAGVREYWLINPLDKNLIIYILENEKFIGKKPIVEDDEAFSYIFPDLKFVLNEIF